MNPAAAKSKRRIPVESVFVNVPEIEFTKESEILRRRWRRERDLGDVISPNERLVNYLASGYTGSLPLRRERRIERNRRLTVTLFLFVILTWFVFQVLL